MMNLSLNQDEPVVVPIEPERPRFYLGPRGFGTTGIEPGHEPEQPSKDLVPRPKDEPGDEPIGSPTLRFPGTYRLFWYLKVLWYL